MIGVGKGARVVGKAVGIGPEVGPGGGVGVDTELGAIDGCVVAVVGSLGAGVTAMVGDNVMLVEVGEAVVDPSKALQAPSGGGTSAPCVTTNGEVSFGRRQNSTYSKVLTNCNHPREKPSIKTG